MKQLTFVLLISTLSALGQSQVDIYSAKDIQAKGDKLAQNKTQFASETLQRYGNHYTMLAYRETTGSSELHQHDADIFFIESGEATIISGGRIVNPRTEKAGEIRGSSIQGGERHVLMTGDVIHIPAGVPHQLLIEKGKPFTYFVVKVTGQ